MNNILYDVNQVLIGLVSGPVMGIAYTTVGLFDYVVCADSVSFLFLL